MAVATAYDDLVATWDTQAGPVYRPLGRALVAASPMPLAGRLVIDVGTGTGAVAEAAAEAGARVVAVDRSMSMAAYRDGRTWPAAAADVLALPFPASTFEAASAGFLLNHLLPAPALAEMARAVRAGGVLLASTWARHFDQVKASIEVVLVSCGWIPPSWYLRMKDEIEPVSGDPACLAAAARQAGLVDVHAAVHRPDLGVRDPRTLVAYRFALPHIAPWLATLDAEARRELTRQAVSAVARHVDKWRPAVVVLTGRVAPQSSRRSAARSNAPA
jgi:ubiquinone/menaquinone biosynthesis C-methylase UbiE